MDSTRFTLPLFNNGVVAIFFIKISAKQAGSCGHAPQQNLIMDPLLKKRDEELY